MATTDIEKLLVRVEANLKQYEKEMARAQGIGVRALRKVEQDTERAASRIERAWARLGERAKAGVAGFAAGLGVEVLARAAASAIKSIADIGDQATKLGVTNQEFQTLSLAAQLAGVEVEALAGGMKKLGINSSDAARGQGEFGAILKANGISLRDANGQMKSQVEVLGIVADLVKNAANEQDGLAIAQAALGKSGNELMGLLEQGAQGVQKAMGEAKAAGVQFTDEQIAKAQEFDDQIDVLIQKISVGLKGSFIDAAIGAASFAAQAIEALDSVGIKASDVGGLIKSAYSYLPVVGPAIGIADSLKARGQLEQLRSRRTNSSDPNGFNTIQKPTGPATILPDKTAEDLRRKIAQETEASEKRATELLKQRREQIQDVITDLTFEGEQLKRNNLEQEIANALRQAGVSATSAQGQEIAALVTANYNLEQSQKAQLENTRLNQEAERELIRLRIDAAEEARVAALEAVEQQQSAFGQLFEMISNGALQGSQSIKQMAIELAKALALSYLLNQGPLKGLFGSGGGFLNPGGGGVPVSLYHKGGVAGQSSGMSRSVSPSLFAGAQRYHDGGIAGLKSGEVPAILQRGERILPRGRGVGGSNVQVIDMRGRNAPPIEQQRDNFGGVRLIIREEVQNLLPGQLAKQVPAQFGFRQQNIRR